MSRGKWYSGKSFANGPDILDVADVVTDLGVRFGLRTEFRLTFGDLRAVVVCRGLPLRSGFDAEAVYQALVSWPLRVVKPLPQVYYFAVLDVWRQADRGLLDEHELLRRR